MNVVEWSRFGFVRWLPDPHQHSPDHSTFRAWAIPQVTASLPAERLAASQALRRRRVKTIAAAPSASVAVPGSGAVTSMIGKPEFTPMLRLLLDEKLPVVSVAVFTLRKN